MRSFQSNGSPTTHILKPDIESVGATAANEFFCLKVAARLGLRAAKVELRQAEVVDDCPAGVVGVGNEGVRPVERTHGEREEHPVERVAEHALRMETARQVGHYLRDQLRRILPDKAAD